MAAKSDKQSLVLNQYKRLNQLVEQIAQQEEKLDNIKALRNCVQQQASINEQLRKEYADVNESTSIKDNELRHALNRVDNLTKQISNHRRALRKKSTKSQLDTNKQNQQQQQQQQQLLIQQQFDQTPKQIPKQQRLDQKQSQLNNRKVCFDPVALMLDAALEGELDLVIETSKKVKNLSASHDENVTALHNAVVADHSDIVKYLVEAGCDINVQDSDGWTPLHCSASANNLPITKFLVEHGASIHAATFSEMSTPISKCDNREQGYEECYNYFKQIQENLGVINNNIVYALYDYVAQKPDELSFQAGDKLQVLKRDDSNEKEWWWAKNESNAEGYIPCNLIGLYPRVK